MNTLRIAGVALLALALGTRATAAPQATRFIGVLVYDQVLTSDVTAPLEVFGHASTQPEFAAYKVVAIAPDKRPVFTHEGLALMPAYSIDDAPPLDALIVGSAYDMSPILGNARLMQWVAARGKDARWIASNCSGARILGEAGLLAGRRATTYPGGELLMKLRYPRTQVVFGDPVVVDGNLVTSSGGLVSYTAAIRLLAAMSSAAFAQKVAGNLYYTRLVPLDKVLTGVSVPSTGAAVDPAQTMAP